jgi:uncharacterized protein YggE
MTRLICAFLSVTLSAAALIAQTTPRTVTATGSATIAVSPDQAQLEVGVVTNAATAQDSAQQNATVTTAVIAALKAVLGSTGSTQTASYSVSPRYSNNPGQPSVIIGYTTSNMLRATTVDLSILGKLIDAANEAGANSVGNLSFGLQDPEPRVLLALSQATRQAMTHAGAIASGLGTQLGQVVSAQQSVAYSPVILPTAGATAAATTPVQTGTVQVFASVTVSAALQ